MPCLVARCSVSTLHVQYDNKVVIWLTSDVMVICCLQWCWSPGCPWPDRAAGLAHLMWPVECRQRGAGPGTLPETTKPQQKYPTKNTPHSNDSFQAATLRDHNYIVISKLLHFPHDDIQWHFKCDCNLSIQSAGSLMVFFVAWSSELLSVTCRLVSRHGSCRGWPCNLTLVHLMPWCRLSITQSSVTTPTLPSYSRRPGCLCGLWWEGRSVMRSALMCEIWQPPNLASSMLDRINRYERGAPTDSQHSHTHTYTGLKYHSLAPGHQQCGGTADGWWLPVTRPSVTHYRC